MTTILDLAVRGTFDVKVRFVSLFFKSIFTNKYSVAFETKSKRFFLLKNSLISYKNEQPTLSKVLGNKSHGDKTS